jgi:hypothetical protein
MVPVAAGLVVPPERLELTVICAVAVPLAGPVAVVAVVFFTTVDAIALPQALLDPLL